MVRPDSGQNRDANATAPPRKRRRTQAEDVTETSHQNQTNAAPRATEAERAKKARYLYFYTTTFDVAVTGADRCEKFTVHKDLACVRCPYFAEVFAAHQNTKILNINAEPDVFKLFMMFLYNHGYYYDPKHFPRSPAVRDGDGPQDRYMVLIRLFRLAEMLKVPALANKAVDQMQRFANEAEYLPKADTINFVYRITAPGSKLRKLMAELWSFRGDTERLAGLVNEEFFQFLMRRKSELIQNSIAQEKPLQALKLPNDRFYLLPYVRAPSPIPVESDDEDMFVNQNRGRQGRPRVPPSPASTATVERADF